ncbi:MAG: rhamnogalacturonan acetylesterase [Prevotella sp.]|nr:rhamnogalacturonan acetylesterase [Prevotella sp.]
MKHLRLLSSCAAVLTAFLLLTSASDRRPTTIFMIGDSTMANKDISHDRKERGWGMALQCYFDPDFIRIDNHAVNGRSTLSFINEGRWDKVLEAMMPGDYVIIQFGHNDEKAPKDRHTDPGSTFDYNLARFIRETREHGGIPVLMNCVVRRNFFVVAPENEDDELLRTTTFQDGVKMIEGDSLIDTHGLYAVAPRDVATRMNCHFVDANRLTHDLEQGLGREASKKLHMWFLPGEEPSVPQGRQDNTHYNVHGAQVVARLLADALCEEVPVLTKYRIEADITVDRRGRGDYLNLQPAIDAALQRSDSPTTIQILGGEWSRPTLPRKHKVTFVLREGATWKD